MSGAPPSSTRPLARLELEQAREQWLATWLAETTTREKPKLKNPEASVNGTSASDRLAERGIAYGEWFTGIKPMLQAAMRPNPGTPLKERVYACGMLHSAAFQSELAVRLESNRYYALTSNDIRNELVQATEQTLANAGIELTDKLKKQIRMVICKTTVRRSLAQLEREGRAVRVVRSTGKRLTDLPKEQRLGLHVGEILLFFPFRPLDPEPSLVDTECLPRFALCSPKQGVGRQQVSTKIRSFFAKLRLLHLTVPELSPELVDGNTYLITEIEGAADDYQKAREVGREASQKRALVAIQRVLIERSSERSSERVSEPSSQERTPEPEPSPTHPFPEIQTAKNAIAATIKKLIGHRPAENDVKLIAIAECAVEKAVPVEIYCWFLESKVAEKKKNGFTITNLAFFETVAKGSDFEYWFSSNRDRLERWLQAKEQEAEQERESCRPLAAEEKQRIADDCENALIEIASWPANQQEQLSDLVRSTERKLMALRASIQGNTQLSLKGLENAANAPD